MAADTEAPWELRDAYAELQALALAERPDWKPGDLDDAVIAAQNAGWSYRQVRREVLRLAGAEGEDPVTLRNSARRPVAGFPTGPEVNARGLAQVLAAIEEVQARKTGGQPVLTEDDNQEVTRGL
jgi:hypothetical protein